LGGNATIKHAAITRAGYEYQDLVGIEVLIRHYRDPDLFEWVQIEADDPGAKALDDVIAMRKDGSVEYVQAKFTVDPEKYFLDWDWLLKKAEAGTSMLAKWAKSYARAKANGSIYSAQLKTNRTPSADFAACMNGTHLDLAKVPAGIRGLIEAECGGTAEAEAFFQKFAFIASMPDLDHFEVGIRDQLVPTDTDNAGWLLLRHFVTRWAVLQRGTTAGRENSAGTRRKANFREAAEAHPAGFFRTKRIHSAQCNLRYEVASAGRRECDAAYRAVGNAGTRQEHIPQLPNRRSAKKGRGDCTSPLLSVVGGLQRKSRILRGHCSFAL
jgi:hypothetical protein